MTRLRETLSGLTAAIFLLIVPYGFQPALAEDAQECLARTLYFEAKDEGRTGMEAVAAVVMNRVDHPEFPDNVCAVVKDGGETPPCQFSYWCDGKSDQPQDQEAWALAQDVARSALQGGTGAPVGDALYFHSDSVDPPYHETRELVATVGSHLFYR